ncbi:MAG: exosortase-associated EpsI family protein, partial [Terrimicrobiaceae bacterium]
MKLAGVIQSKRFGVPIWRSLIVIALTALTVAACLWVVPPPSRSETGVDMNLPASVDKFVGSDQEISPSERVILPPDTEFAKKLCTHGNGERISCQIVLAGGKKRSIHRPEVCLPAQGWTLKTGEV